MNNNVTDVLDQYEQKVADGAIGSFTVYIQEEGIRIKPEGSETAEEISLLPDLQNSLQIFFSGIPSIAYGSLDYTTLKSLLNAHACLERMNKRADNSSLN